MIPCAARGCLVTAVVWRDCPALVSPVCCPLHNTLLRLPWAMSEDWLTTRHHHPHSSSIETRIFYRPTKSLTEKKTPLTCSKYLTSRPIPEQWNCNRVLHHNITLQAATLSPFLHITHELRGMSYILPQPQRHHWVGCTQNFIFLESQPTK